MSICQGDVDKCNGLEDRKNHTTGGSMTSERSRVVDTVQRTRGLQRS